MTSSVLHSCPFCGHVANISEILADFVGNPHCTQCGLSASEGNLKLQDDLVSLFNTHMTMGSSASPEPRELQPSPPPITYSITQHYHHSAHVARKTAASKPMQSNTLSVTNSTADQAYEETLRRHNVDPSTLTTSQLELFANAMPDQQTRLIHMWQIFPEPSKSAHRSDQKVFTGDLEMYESTQQQHTGDNSHCSAEPYMLAGYDLVSESSISQAAYPVREPTTGSPYTLSTDPIYQAGGQRWWERAQEMTTEY